MTKIRKVAVTGLGLISPLGLNVPENLRHAYEGRNGIRVATDRLWGGATEQLGCQVAGTVVGFDPTLFVEAHLAHRYDATTILAIAASDEAVRDAGLDTRHFNDRAGCFVGGAVPGADTWQRGLHQSLVERKTQALGSSGAMAVSGNMPPGLIALRHRLRGPTSGVANACAAGITAMSLAADQIRLGRADVMLAGGAESALLFFLYMSFNNANALNATCDPHRAMRPFSGDRAGFVPGEGCGMVVLEELEHAQARGAPIYAMLAGEAISNDAYHIIRPEPEGQRWARTMEMALQAADVSLEEVSYVSAHAASTPLGDVAETRALKLLFGRHAQKLAVSATKSMHGHAWGGSSAIETVLALAAISTDRVLPTMHLNVPDPECDLDYVANSGRQASTSVLLKNSFGYAGANASAVFVRNRDTTKSVAK